MFEYEMPEHIKPFINREFCTQFLKELHMIFGSSLEDTDMDYWVYQTGTAGWGTAFATACRKLCLDELFKYYEELSWEESDIFDGIIEDALIEYGLILDGSEGDEIAKQNGLTNNDVKVCSECGGYFHVNDVTLLHVDDDWTEYSCKNCQHDGEAIAMPWNKERSIQEQLKLKTSRYFKCDKCGKFHLMEHKGNRYCLHCEIDGSDTNANQYYLEMLEAVQEYKERVFV